MMKKMMMMAMLFALSSLAQAEDFKFVNGDGSKYTELCIAAVESDEALSAKAEELKVRNYADKKFLCNGMTMNRFIAKYRGQDNSNMKVFSFVNWEDSMAADLCIAAATSNEAFIDALEDHFGSSRNVVKKGEITCNRMSIERFAHKYGNPDFKI